MSLEHDLLQFYEVQIGLLNRIKTFYKKINKEECSIIYNQHHMEIFNKIIQADDHMSKAYDSLLLYIKKRTESEPLLYEEDDVNDVFYDDYTNTKGESFCMNMLGTIGKNIFITTNLITSILNSNLS